MQKITEDYGRTLYWVQHKDTERGYELRVEDKVFAKLVFQSAWGTLATGSNIDESWTFKRVGFLNPRVTIRPPGEETNVAEYWPKFWGGGKLIFPDGRQFLWDSANFWGTQWIFSDAVENRLFVFLPGGEKPKIDEEYRSLAVVEIDPRAFEHPELPLLLVLGWYLMVLQQEDSSAGSAAIVAGGSAA